MAYLLLSAGIALDHGLLAWGAWTTFVPHTVTVAWLAATSTLLFRRREARSRSVPVMVGVYEVHNVGAWYDFGFVLGLGFIVGGGSSGARSAGR